MELVLLGTGGAYRYPSLWCSCKNCEEARQRGGRNLRSNSCLWLKPNLLIDFPPEIGSLSDHNHISLSNIQAILFTHSHPDHFYPWYFQWHSRRRYSHEDQLSSSVEDSACLSRLSTLNIYGSSYVCSTIKRTLGMKELEYDIILNDIRPWKEFKIGNYAITPVLANHNVLEDTAFNYIIHEQSTGATLFYGLDSGMPAEETLVFLTKFSFDVVIVDTAGGGVPDEKVPAGHMNISMASELRRKLLRAGVLKKEGYFILSHFTHFAPIYDVLARDIEDVTLKIGYDGMRISVKEGSSANKMKVGE